MKKSVLVIGGEANGASQEIKKHSISIKIPMHGKVESLNAAMAGTIIMFEAMRQKNNNP
jgi:TrmH family RNA methyltransferase